MTFRRDVVSAFESLGYRVAGSQTSPEHGSDLVVLEKGDVRVRIVTDRGQRFIDIGSVTTEEWFDARLVLAELGLSKGATRVTDQGFRILYRQLLSSAARWEDLFERSNYEGTRAALASRERASAHHRFRLGEDLSPQKRS